jgi:hypothetical protein
MKSQTEFVYIYIHTKFKMPRAKYSLFIAVTLKTKYMFRRAVIFICFFPVALQPLPGLGLLFRFRNLLYTYGRTPWMSDQLIGRPLPTQDNTNIEQTYIHINIHASSRIRTYDTIIQASQDSFFLFCEAFGTVATPGLLCQPRMIVKMIVEKRMECRFAGETEVLGENLPQRYFRPSQNSTWRDPGLNPGRRGGKPATNRLSYGEAWAKTVHALDHSATVTGHFFYYRTKLPMTRLVWWQDCRLVLGRCTGIFRGFPL